MFNNPFGSFHDTVAAAKKEREQLDRLLTISTPRERLLVAGIAVLLLVLAAWLVFGSVARTVAVDGVRVEPDERPIEGNRSVRAMVWVESGIAPRIEIGVPAVIELAATDGDPDTLEGEVARFAAVALSEGPAALISAGPLSVYRLEIALNEGLDPASVAGRKCRVVLDLGRRSPVALFETGRP